MIKKYNTNSNTEIVTDEEGFDLIKKYGKVCYTCNSCCCDCGDEEDPDATFWCSNKKIGTITTDMNLNETYIHTCPEWTVVDDTKEVK